MQSKYKEQLTYCITARSCKDQSTATARAMCSAWRAGGPSGSHGVSSFPMIWSPSRPRRALSPSTWARMATAKPLLPKSGLAEPSVYKEKDRSARRCGLKSSDHGVRGLSAVVVELGNKTSFQSAGRSQVRGQAWKSLSRSPRSCGRLTLSRLKLKVGGGEISLERDLAWHRPLRLRWQLVCEMLKKRFKECCRKHVGL